MEPDYNNLQVTNSVTIEPLVMVTIRCTKEQRESLKERAKLWNMSLNKYLLARLLPEIEG